LVDVIHLASINKLADLLRNHQVDFSQIKDE